MFGLFKRKPPADPPTQRQLNYAKKLNLTVTSAMSKDDVSNLISVAEAKYPKAKRQREHINRKRQEQADAQSIAEDAQWIAECGPELLETERKWQAFSEGEGYILAVYVKGKDTIVDVLRVNDVYIEGKKRKTLKLHVEAPKLTKDKYIGDYLEWERDFEVPIDKLLYHEALPNNFYDLGIPAYQKAVERGLEIAKRL
jgi:hypothetical protein